MTTVVAEELGSRLREMCFALAGLLLVWAGASPVSAGDSIYGNVTEVKSADLVTFNYGTGQYDLRLIGIEVPQDESIAKQATAFVSDMLLGKKARMRFEGRAPTGEMMSRLFSDDPDTGIQEVAVELVRAGLARRERDFDFKYGELAAAEREARDAKRGLWARYARE